MAKFARDSLIKKKKKKVAQIPFWTLVSFITLTLIFFQERKKEERRSSSYTCKNVLRVLTEKG